MLHKETVARETFEILKELMQDQQLQSFSLAGGTALALYLGHRISIDLDLFSPEPFDAIQLEKHLIEKYQFKGDYLEKNTLKGTIDNVKIDCITHSYPYVESLIIFEENIRLYSVRDIAAMKLAAIADNGTRLKDFVDIACLSTKLTLNEMLSAYQEKFSNSNSMRALKGLTFFQDILFDEPIQMVSGDYKWKKTERRINNMIKCSDKLFDHFHD